jgi:hypothetical protein
VVQWARQVDKHQRGCTEKHVDMARFAVNDRHQINCLLQPATICPNSSRQGLKACQPRQAEPDLTCLSPGGMCAGMSPLPLQSRHCPSAGSCALRKEDRKGQTQSVQ